MDDENRITAFGGVTGRVLNDSMSISTAFTGVVLGLILLTSGFVCNLVQARTINMIFWQAVIAIALARFALNGFSGESKGTILSSAGGSWPQVLAVAGRYLTLNLLWMVPLVLMAFGAASAAMTQALHGVAEPGAPGAFGAGASPFAPAGGGMSGAGGLALMLPILAVFTSKSFLLTVGLLMLGMALLPPVFLIVAVRSAAFGDIFAPAGWRAAFAGRWSDLYVIYVVHGGALGMLIIMAIPALLLCFSAGSEIGILFLLVTMAYFGGLAVTLLGRLCGFFAFGDEHDPAFGMSPGRGAEAAQQGAEHAAGGHLRPVPRRPPEIHGEPVFDKAGTAGPVEAGDPGEGAESVPDGSGKPPLLEPAERVAESRRRFDTDPEGALRELQELREAHASSPQVMHALTLCFARAARLPEAVQAARDAVPLCLARGNVVLAAEMFSALWKQAGELGLSRDQIDAIAAALAKTGDQGHAIAAFGMALQMDHGDRKAIKGLLQLADARMHRDGRPKDAARIYTFLLQYASGTPFADDMRRGLAEAEARLGRAS